MKIIIAILVFSLIIIIHEFGHLLFAKLNGIRVLEFSIGLGPTIIGKNIGETKYSIKLLPFGGLCQMLGEDSSDQEPLPGSFTSKSVLARMSVVLAGPVFNFILAFLLAIIVVAISGYDPAYVTDVPSGSNAEAAGFEKGDVIVNIDGSHVSLARDISVYETYDLVSDDEITVVVKRNGERIKLFLTPEKIEKYLLGFQYSVNDAKAEISEIIPGYAFEKAGIRAGDTITYINGTKINTGTDISNYFNSHQMVDDSKTVTVTYERNGRSTTVELTPAINVAYDLGFSYNEYAEKAGFFNVIRYSFVEVGFQIKMTFKSLGMLFSGRVSVNEMSGVVGIVDQIGDTYETAKDLGAGIGDILSVMLAFSVLLSANLGVMNLLPIPALDGGRFLLLIVEGIKRKPLNRKVEAIVNLAGFALLMLLMVVIMFNDIRKLFI